MRKVYEKYMIMFIFLMSLLSPAFGAQPIVVTEGFQQVGVFTGLPEISGMAFSKTKPGIVYLHNDSGDVPRFFVSTINGVAKYVSLNGQVLRDYEDMSLGPCGNGNVNDCLYIADVGDNGESRQDYRIIIVQEAEFGNDVIPLKSLALNYSDKHSHNVEAIAVHPITGDLFLTTKVGDNPHVYKVSGTAISTAPTGGIITAVDIGTIDLGSLFSGADETITGMAISPTGTQFALLSYTQIYEFEFDLSAWQTVWTSQLVDINKVHYKPTKLQQQEAIAYNKDGVLFFTTETNNVAIPAAVVQVPKTVIEIPTGPPIIVTSPVVSGTYVSGKTLTASPGVWKGVLPISLTYQWKRCNLVGTGCLNIAKATSSTYVLTDADLKHTVRVRINAKNSAGTSFASTSPVLVVATLPSTNFPLGTVCNATGSALIRPALVKHVIVILFENRDAGAVVGNAAAPYFNSIRAQCGSSTQFLDNAFPTDLVSLPHYLALTSGSNCNTGLGTSGSGCITNDSSPNSRRLTTRSIFNQVSSWKAYQEDMPRACDWGNPASGTKYWVKHNPPPYFTQVTDCGVNDIGIPRLSCPTSLNGTCGTPQGTFTTDLANDTLPAYSFVTPDICNDSHDCSVTVGDNWLHTVLPDIFKSPAYLRGEVAIHVLYDEEEGSFTQGPIPNLFISPYVQPTISNVVINHYSALRLAESQLGITEFLGCASGVAPGGGSCPAGSTTDLREIFNF